MFRLSAYFCSNPPCPCTPTEVVLRLAGPAKLNLLRCRNCHFRLSPINPDASGHTHGLGPVPPRVGVSAQCVNLPRHSAHGPERGSPALFYKAAVFASLSYEPHSRRSIVGYPLPRLGSLCSRGRMRSARFPFTGFRRLKRRHSASRLVIKPLARRRGGPPSKRRIFPRPSGDCRGTVGRGSVRFVQHAGGRKGLGCESPEG